MSDHENLKLLGQTKTAYPETPEEAILETFPNPYPEGPYLVTLRTEEFTSLCPKTGQPDFGWVEISYVPKDKCIESKALKLFLFSFRNEGGFWERQMNRIARMLVEVLDPQWLKIEGEMKARGGITLKVRVEYDPLYASQPWSLVYPR